MVECLSHIGDVLEKANPARHGHEEKNTNQWKQSSPGSRLFFT